MASLALSYLCTSTLCAHLAESFVVFFFFNFTSHQFVPLPPQPKGGGGGGLCLIVCFARWDMFRTNTWIREHRGHTVTPAPADEIVLDFLRQTELQAVPVSAGSRTFLFFTDGV